MGKWRYSSTASHLCRFTPGQSTPNTLYVGRLGGPQRRSRRYGEEKNLLHLPGIEPLLLGLPASTLILIYLSIHGPTALVDLGRFFSFLIYSQSVGPLERGISPSQGRYVHTE
jgi:hypothetical protein